MSEETKFKFDLKFQQKIIKLAIVNPIVLNRCVIYVEPHYFETKWLQWAYKTTIDYYKKYQKVITEDVFCNEIMGLDSTKENLLEYVSAVKLIFAETIEEEEYIINKLEEFIKRNIFIQNMKDIVNLYNKNRFDEAVLKTEATWNEVSQVNFDDSDQTFFFKDFDARIAKRDIKLNSTSNKFMSGVLELDSKLGGGLEPGELGIVVADAKVGKSICLINVGASIALSRCGKVLHINLEGKDGQVEDRYEARILKTDYNKIKRNEISRDAFDFYPQLKDSLVLCNMISRWDYTVIDIENKIKELRTRNWMPDVVIVDYGDLLQPIEASKDNTYQAQREVFRQLKTLANKYRIVVWTASQMARAPKDANPMNDRDFVWTRKNLADCYEKVRTADLLITLNMTNVERESRQMRLYVDAYRDSECGYIIPINTDYSKMQFYVPSPTSFERSSRDMR